MGWHPTIPVVVESDADASERLGPWRVRVPTAREAVAIVRMGFDTTQATNARLRRICAAWWPLSMMGTLFARIVAPELPLVIAQDLVSRCAPPPEKAGDVYAQTSDAPDEWDEIAVELMCEGGITLDTPFDEWFMAAMHLDRIRARRALNNLAWYAAAKSGKDNAYRDLMKRAGLGKKRKKKRKAEKPMTEEEGLEAFKALKGDFQQAGIA